MNYCILNGIKSTLIKGLLIQSLPPITKPMMRTSVEEIDGRDGDIVSKLGYSAYDKEMSIGLFGDYDIDQVIKYFNSEGTVIFSNEPDKFYNYEIIDQIDFERLIRFKTATVTFHVQPFKYSAVDDLLTYEENKLFFNKFNSSYRGIDCDVEETIKLSGLSEQTVEFSIPIRVIEAKAEVYSLYATASGTGAEHIQLRLIHDTPSYSNTFGGSALNLEEGTTSKSATSARTTYNYVWVSIESGYNVDVEISVRFVSFYEKAFTAFNRGNVISRPKMTIYGSGNLTISINSGLVFRIALGTEEYITIDGADMNAYKDDVLKNRLVTGDYSYLTLKSGINVISWTGNISKIEMENVSRYI